MKKFIFKLFIILFLSPIANSSEIKKIVEGDLNAKIKIIVYESLTCSHCANFHKDVYPELKNEFIDTGLASIEFRNFPLDMAALMQQRLHTVRMMEIQKFFISYMLIKVNGLKVKILVSLIKIYVI